MITDDIEKLPDYGYTILTEEKFKEILKDLIIADKSRHEELKGMTFPTTKEIEALDDNSTYYIPSPAGMTYMSGKSAKEFNKMLIAELLK